MSPENNREILVVGAGIGGLSAALALTGIERRVRLFEQAPEIAPIGYGIQLGPNTLPIFERLGVGSKVLAKSFLPRSLVMLEANGEALGEVPLEGSDFQRRFAGRYMAIHRSDLHDILMEAVAERAGAAFETSQQITGYVAIDGGVRITSDSGASFDGAALIAADGLKSIFRAILHPDDGLRPANYVAHRSVVPMADMPAGVSRDSVVLWLGPGWHMIHYPLRDRSELNVVAVFRDELCSPDPDPAVRKSVLQGHLKEAAPALKAVLDSMNLERSWPIADRNPLRKWGAGRMTLLGDAAHASLQSLAQGAGMAIEDAAVIGHCVETAGEDYATAFENFRKARFVRSSRVILESRRLWPMYHEEDPTDQDVRRQQYQGMTADDFHACFRWLWQPGAEAQLEGALR